MAIEAESPHGNIRTLRFPEVEGPGFQTFDEKMPNIACAIVSGVKSVFEDCRPVPRLLVKAKYHRLRVSGKYREIDAFSTRTGT